MEDELGRMEKYNAEFFTWERELFSYERLSSLISLLLLESVVGESVVVIRKLLQSETVGHKDIIRHMARLVDKIKIPMARASILWLLGEYCDKVPKIAPDVLRKMAKTFTTEVGVKGLRVCMY